MEKEFPHDKLQERVEALEELLEISLLLNSTLDLDSLLKIILEFSKQGLSVQAVSILLVDKKTGELFFQAAVGERSEIAKPFRIAPGEGIEGAVLKAREPIIVNNAQQDPRLAKWFDYVSGIETSTLLAVPLWVKGQLIGVLEFINKTTPKGSIAKFSEDDVKKASVLSNMAAIAIDNAQIYQELSNSYEMVKKAEELKSQFISIITHELRTPLVPIQGYAHLLRQQQEGITPVARANFLDEIIRQSEHLTMLIEDLFWVNKFESADIFMEQDTIEFEQLIQEALLVKKVDQTTHPVSILLDSSLSEQRKPRLKVDRLKFVHALVHVLDNAVKFSPQGGAVTISLSSSEEFLLISLADEGIGVAERYHEKIFERFFQVDSSSTREFGGTGIGLFIVKKIIEAHRGKIWCESAPQKGTRIIIQLPKELLL